MRGEGRAISVREALVSDPRVLAPGTSVREAAELLVRPSVVNVLVVEGERLLGCVTRDTIVAALAAGTDLAAATVAEVCDPDVATIGPDATLDEAIHLMGERDLERLAVVEGGRFLGVVAREPLVRRLAEDEAPEPQQQV